MVFIPLKTECAGTFLHERCRRRQLKPTSRSCRRKSTKMSATSASPPRDYTRKVYRRRLGSGPAKQWKKKDSDRKSSSVMAFGTWSFL
jgi:hypothetical protein